MFKKICAVFVFLFAFTFLFSAVNAQAATLYWYKSPTTADANWDTLGNWWTDAAHTVPATKVPGKKDSVITTGSVGPIVTGSSEVSSITATATGITFNGNGSNLSPIIGNAVFNDASVDYAGINGDVVFNGTSRYHGNTTASKIFTTINMDPCPITGCTFGHKDRFAYLVKPDRSKIKMTGKVTFNDRSSIDKGVAYDGGYQTPAYVLRNGEKVYYSGSVLEAYYVDPINEGLVEFRGNATFNGDSSNNGKIIGDATFNGASKNTGTVSGTTKTSTTMLSGTLTFADGEAWAGTPTKGSDGLPIKKWIFNGNSYSNAPITGDAIFNGTSYNNNKITGNAIFNDNSDNKGTIDGDVTFNGNSRNDARITGNVIFNDTSENNKSINGDVQFKGFSVNTNNTVLVTKTHYIQRISVGTYDTTYMDMGSFDDLVTTKITGDVTFAENSKNLGRIVGDVTLIGDNATSTIVISASGIKTKPYVYLSYPYATNASMYDKGFGTVALITTESAVTGSKTRIYRTNTTTVRDFVTGGPWTIIADGAVVNVSGARYDTTTKFQTLNGGSFVPNVTSTTGTSVPVVTLTATPSSITSGQTSTITWSATNTTGATPCTTSGAGGVGVKAASGSITTPTLTTDSTFNLSCTGAGGTGTGSATVTVTSGTVNTTQIGSIMLKRIDKNINSLTTLTTPTISTSQVGVDALAKNSTNPSTFTNLSVGLHAHTAYTTDLAGYNVTYAQCTYATTDPQCNLADAAYTDVDMTCSSGYCSLPVNVAADTVTKVVFKYVAKSATTVTTTPPPVITSTPAPTVTISASPTSVTSGQSSRITWSSTNATYCGASGAWSGTKNPSGSENTGSINSTSNYYITCRGAGGSTSGQTSVTVTGSTVSDAPTLTFTATPTTVSAGQAATLSWSSTGLTSCNAYSSWLGSKSVSGSQSTGPLTSSDGAEYDLVCSGPKGSITKSVNVAVTGSTAIPVTVLPWTAPASVEAGKSLAYTLNWSGGPLSNGSASDQWQIFAFYRPVAGGTNIPTSNFLPAQPASSWSGSAATPYSVLVPVNITPGIYEVSVGMFHYSDQVRAVLTAGPGTADLGSRIYKVGTFTVTPTTAGVVTASASLASTNENKAGEGLTFAPGSSGSNPNDFRWDLVLTMNNNAKTITAIDVTSGPISHWTTGTNGWAIVAIKNGQQLNTAPNQTISVGPEPVTLSLYGQQGGSANWSGGIVTVTFDDGTTVSANIPAVAQTSSVWDSFKSLFGF